MLNSIIAKVQSLNNGLDFMEGRDKSDIVLGETYHINDFGFLTGENGEYVVFTVKNDDNHFFFGASILTQKMKDLEAMLSGDEMEELLTSGLEVVFGERKSEKSKRKYITCEFFPSLSKKFVE